jgi:cytochrome c2
MKKRAAPLLHAAGWVLLGLALLAAPPRAWAGGEIEFLPADPLEGQQVFRDKLCIQCHSIQGAGGTTGPDLGEVWLGSFMDIASKLWNHFPRMNEAYREAKLRRPTLNAQEAQKLITFLYFLNYFDRTAKAQVGEMLFREKNCVRCHSVGGKGGSVGPALDEFQGSYAAAFITAELWNRGPKMMRTMAARHIPRPSFEQGDVVDILAFIREKGFYDQPDRSYVTTADPVRGREVFEKKGCIHCHSIAGKGGTLAPDLTTRGLKGSLSSILSHLWNHGSKMWPTMEKEGIAFPQFSPEEMSNLMTYLYFLDFRDPPGSAARGKEVFVENRCAVCHLAAFAEGKPIGPDLSNVGPMGPFKVIAEMWNHSPAIQERMRQRQMRWPLLDKEQLRDLIEYVLSMNAKG